MDRKPVTYTFEDPNREGAVMEMLRRILLEKLTAGHQEAPGGAGERL